MPSPQLVVNETDIVRLVSEFLQNRQLNISMMSLERETGIINGMYSDDMLFLRQLILDGQWDDVIDFIQPLVTVEHFDMKKFQYIIMKHKYLELLCIKSDPNVMQNYEFTVDEVVKCLNSLEELCPSKEEYSNLCFLLSLPKLSDHIEYQNWNPSNARVECFKDICPLVEKFLPIDGGASDKSKVAKNDRLIQLVLKGLLYESCVEYCQQQATNDDCDLKYMNVLNDNGFSDADLSLISWLLCIPYDTFSCPFEQKQVNIDVQPLIKPSLEASWSEQILVTPIKPKMFPHSAVPTTRPRSAEMMTRSLNPQFDGLSSGLIVGRRDPMNTSGDYSLLSRSVAPGSSAAAKNPMLQSIDKLFSHGEVINTHSSIMETPQKTIPEHPVPANYPSSESPRRLQESSSNPASTVKPIKSISPRNSGSTDSADRGQGNTASPRSSTDNELYKEYHRQRQKLQVKKTFLFDY
ncbi:hypothetical protein LOTGIDRAFT_130238 [Lottia gigantea]|uniref:CTLH domain-containing protein n=1 Tax=Lottia gigantea TaxID=225164 RepID=V4BAF8_LOTGI|nr:hypothetical protein LOTGIDRAFT_130238 [Lottia gigantea]ESO85934.1 hypothetical protein LOTGIDRAFT_130238 [Lottia gigantea]